MKISVIIPVYNAAAYLKECLLSVLTQCYYGEIEIIAVNDGSTDGSDIILRDFYHSYPCVRVIDRPNGGLSAARNTGLRESNGDVVIFLDADDILLPNALRILAEIREKTGAPVVSGRIIRSKRNSQFPGYKSNSLQDGGLYTIEAHQVIEKTLYQTWYPYAGSVGAKMFERRLFHGISFLEGSAYEDLDILPRLYLKAGMIGYSSIAVYGYRDNPLSFMNKWSPRRKDIFAVLDRLEAVLIKENNNAGIQKSINDRRLSAAFNMLVLLKEYGVDDKVLQDNCNDIIRSQRLGAIFNGRSSFRSRMASLLSYFGTPVVISLYRMRYGN